MASETAERARGSLKATGKKGRDAPKHHLDDTDELSVELTNVPMPYVKELLPPANPFQTDSSTSVGNHIPMGIEGHTYFYQAPESLKWIFDKNTERGHKIFVPTK